MSIGLPEAEFWRSTPRQVARKFQGYERARVREHNDRMTQAYLTARLVRVAAKSFPRLKKLMLRDPNRKPQAWQDMKQIAMHLTLSHGGEVKKEQS